MEASWAVCLAHASRLATPVYTLPFSDGISIALFTTPPKMLIPGNVPSKQRELALLHAALLFHVSLAVVIQFLGVGSAVVFFIISLGIGLGITAGFIVDYSEGTNSVSHGVRPIVSSAVYDHNKCIKHNVLGLPPWLYSSLAPRYRVDSRRSGRFRSSCTSYVRVPDDVANNVPRRVECHLLFLLSTSSRHLSQCLSS